MERADHPHTVFGLIDKRRELLARLKLAQAEVNTCSEGIDAIDVVLKLFAPEIVLSDIRPKRLPVPHGAARGEMQRIAFDLLREAEPVTAQMLAERFCQARNLTLDEAGMSLIRTRAAKTLGSMAKSRLIKLIDKEGMVSRWGPLA